MCLARCAFFSKAFCRQHQLHTVMVLEVPSDSSSGRIADDLTTIAKLARLATVTFPRTVFGQLTVKVALKRALEHAATTYFVGTDRKSVV